MARTKIVFNRRTVLIWAIILLVVPFGFTMDKPVQVIGSFLKK